MRIMTMVNKMTAAKKKYIRWIALVVVVIFYFCYRTGFFIHPEGTLLIGHVNGIYARTFENKRPGKLFFADSAYENYHSPLMENGDFFCVGVQKEQQDDKVISALFMVKGGDPQQQKPEIVFKTSGYFIRYVFTTNRDTIFYTKKGALFKYQKGLAAEAQLYRNARIVDTRLLLMEDRVIICTIADSKDDRLYSVAQIDTMTGEMKIVSPNSRLLTWLEKDKSILYRKPGGEIYCYDLRSEKSEKFGATDLIFTGVVSPDNAYLLAWAPQQLGLEIDGGVRLIFPQHGKYECYIITPSGKQAKKLDFLQMIDGVSENLCWIP